MAQSATDLRDLIEWNEHYELTWEDFNGVPTEDAAGDAGAAVSIKVKPYRVGKKIRYDVRAYFNKQKSWAVDTSQLLLSHEQLHFDIAELYARKIRKKISDLEARHVNDTKVYNQAIEQLLEESNATDAQYDVETLHGALNKKQQAWVERISRELEALELYKKQKQIIGAGKQKS